MKPIIERLRSRRIVQWALAYLAAAWLTLQVLELLADVYSWPPAILRGAVPLLAAGLLVTLVLAWYHGERGAQRARPAEVVLLAGIVLLATSATVFIGRSAGDAPGSAAPADAAASSVAVLPFVNSSDDPEQEYFSDGITDELLHALAQIPGVFVPGRTSSFAFKDRNLSVARVASDLGVAHVLEGSVRVDGQGDARVVRITARLIDARSGGQLWSERYDRRLADIFAVQEEIARAIVGALRPRFAREQPAGIPLVARGTESVESYQLYLRALAHFNQRRLRPAVAAADSAIAFDSLFARPHAIRAAAYAALHGTSGSERERLATEVSVRRALDLEPTLALPHSSLGLVYTSEWRWADAEREHRAAVAADPASADAHHWLGWHLLAVGRIEEAAEAMHRATVLDPLAPVIRRNYGMALLTAGRPRDALTQLVRADSLHDGTDVYTRVYLGWAAAAVGDTALARRAVRADQAGDPGLMVSTVLAAVGDTARARSIVDRVAASGTFSRPSLVAAGYIALGDREAAIRFLQMAYQRRDPSLFLVLHSRRFDSVREDPRVRAMMVGAGLGPGG